MYDIGVILLIIAITRHFQNSEGQMKRDKIQVLYADNPALADSFSWMKDLFEELFWLGKYIGYHPKTNKSIIITSREIIGIANTLLI